MKLVTFPRTWNYQRNRGVFWVNELPRDEQIRLAAEAVKTLIGARERLDAIEQELESPQTQLN